MYFNGVLPDIIGILSGPMVYIASYWQPESSCDVRIFSNCEEVALYINGQLIEKKGHDSDEMSTHLTYPPFTFGVKEFKRGILKAVAYIDDSIVASHSISTPELPVALKLSYDISDRPINKTRKDVVFIYASVLDINGTLCPVNDRQVEFSVEGNAILIGQNPTNTEAGIATILLQTNGNFKEITIGAKANNLKSARLIVE